MKKIGIITINDFNNYGNRLQCYAVQCCLESMGYLGENIYNTYSRDGFIVNSGRKIIRKLRSFRRRNIVAVRKQNFTEFNQNIRFSKDRIINGRFDKDLSDRYDFFITGSDQVWNPYDSGRSEIDFLTFASEEKRISFSASMGVEKIPDQMREKYREYLKDYHRISVREETAKMIIEELIGRTDIEVLVDPTMLLTAKEWEKVSVKPGIPYNSRYILAYFLGGLGTRAAVIKSIAEKYSCEIIDIYDMNSVFYTCGAQHFLELEKNAFLICTDSFHSAVFAFLFNRPFIVFDRENTKFNMDSRMETFLSKFGLQQSKYRVDRDVDQYFNWNYTAGYETLEKEREKARRFLANALS